MLSWLRRKDQGGLITPVEGQIGYFGLASWWLTAFTPEERMFIEERFQPLGSGGDRPLTQGKIVSTSETAAGLLQALSGWFNRPDERHLALKIAQKAEELALAGQDPEDAHFTYQQLIEINYRERKKDPGALGRAIEACQKQIAIAPRVARSMRRKYKGAGLPAHVGFEQLVIIREKEGRYAEAIHLCQEARKQGWRGNWEVRVEKLNKKLIKEGGGRSEAGHQ